MSNTEYRNAGRVWFPNSIFIVIAEQVAAGKSIAEICENPAMPSKSTVYQAIAADPLLSQKFAAATRAAVEKRAKQSA